MKRTTFFLSGLFACCWLLLSYLPAAAEACVWVVEGYVKVQDDLFVEGPKQTKPLQGATVIVYASAQDEGGWEKWGEVVLNERGHYIICQQLDERDPEFCTQKRRFKVLVELDHKAYVRLTHAQPRPTVWREEIFSTKKMYGPDVQLPLFVFDALEDGTPYYSFTKAATIFSAYYQLSQQLDLWGLQPTKAVVAWPAHPATGTGAPGWMDPVANCVRISPSWFKHNTWFDEPGESLDWSKRAQELTRAYVQHWFLNRVYEPLFPDGKFCSSEDLKASPELAFYEAFAAFASEGLNKAVFGMTARDVSNIRSRHEIYRRFLETEMDPDVEPCFSQTTLQAMVEGNSEEWQTHLYRSQAAVDNYLRMLTVDDWYFLDFGDDFTQGSRLATFNAEAEAQHECDIHRAPMFSLHELFLYLEMWSEKSLAGTIPEPRSIETFYGFLASRDPMFGEVVGYFIKLGNPHFAGKVHAWDACQFKAVIPEY